METASISFGEPAWLLAVIVIIPAATLLLWWANRRKNLLLQQVVAPRLVEKLVRSMSKRRQSIRTLCLLSTLTLLVITLAKPRLGSSSVKTVQAGRDIIIAVDVSQSMLATDLVPNRLTRAKLFVQDCLNLLHGDDRLGLISFAGTAFLQIPLTTDYSAIMNSIKELDTNFILRGGTNIASAIRIAKKTFGHFNGSMRALILISDGEELEGKAIIEAKKAASQGIRIYTIGIGSVNGALLPLTTENGRQDFIRDTDGNPVTSRFNADCLKEISEATNGLYCPLNTSAAQQIVSHILSSLAEQQGQALISSHPIERFEWTLIPSIFLLLVWWLTGNQKRALSQHSPIFLDLLLLGILSVGTPIHAEQSGLNSYRKGDYQKALKDFERCLQKRPNLAEASFNAGTAAYKLRDYDKALDYFGRAMLGKSNSLRISAQYNMGNSLARKGEGSLSNDQKRAQWIAAIQQYDQVLQQHPEHRFAADNKKLVQQMLKDIENLQNQKENLQNQNSHSDLPLPVPTILKKGKEGGVSRMEEKTELSHMIKSPPNTLTEEQADALIDSIEEEELHLTAPPRQEAAEAIYKNW